jgi:serine/threonine-protein kinase
MLRGLVEQPHAQLVAQLFNEIEVADLIEAALARRVALVPLSHGPRDRGEHELHLQAPGVAGSIVLIASLSGKPTDGIFPLLLRPVTEADVVELEAFLSAVRASWVPRQRSMVRASQAPDEPVSGPAPVEQSRDSAVPELDALIGRTLGGGRYEILALIGEGGMGRVYEARHVALDKKIAVKVLRASHQRDPEFSARFQQEALAASKLDHPNAMQVIDFGEEKGGLSYIAMELLTGRSLSGLLEDRGKLSLEHTLEIVGQVCAALAVAHDSGIVHRDMKPENIMLVPKRDDEGAVVETVKVCDFGLAKISEATAGSRHRPSVDGGVKGTPEYMSPEQARGEPTDLRTDIYACGVILYELVTGVVPFTADTPLAILMKHVMEAPVPPSRLVPSLNRDLEAVILKAMEKDRGRRYQSARELRDALRLVLEGASVAAGPAWYDLIPAPPPSVPRMIRRPTPPVGSVHAPVPAAPVSAPTNKAPSSARTPPVAPVAGAVPEPDAAAVEQRVDALLQNAEAVLRALYALTGKDAYLRESDLLEHAMRVLARDGKLDVLWATRGLFGKVARGSAVGSTSREGLAARAVASLSAPDVLGWIAEALMAGKPAMREPAKALLVAAGTGGASALCAARVSADASAASRPRFVAALKELGECAAPAIAGALAALAPEGEVPGLELAEDLLRSVPPVADRELGREIARFTESESPAVRRAAVGALAGAWGERAKDVLLRSLKDGDEGVKAAALAGLRRIGAVGRDVVEHVSTHVGPRATSPEEVRAAAIAALADVQPEARAPAYSVLVRALEPRQNSIVGRLRGDEGESALVIETAASVMLKIGGTEGRRLVENRANMTKGELRDRLRAMLRG